MADIEQKYPHLFTPIRVGNRIFRNRITSAPHSSKHKTMEGFPEEFDVACFEARAKGGAAQVTTGVAQVSSKYREIQDYKVLILRDGAEPKLTEVAMGIKRHGAMASIELDHPGCDAKPQFSGGRLPIAPSGYMRPDGLEVLEMTEEQIQDTIKEFADAAAFAKKCLFDMCTIHGGHGWLIHQFISSVTNHRTDKWGGSLENRCRFAIEVCKAIKKACGPDFLIEFRYSVCDFTEGGIDIPTGVEIAKIMEPYVDMFQASGSNRLVPALQEFGPTPHVIYDQGFFIEHAAALKAAGIKKPVVAIGSITTPEMAEEIIASGKADMVALGRALVCDPDFPYKASHGLREEIIPCFRCEKCRDTHTTRQCALNPKQGRFVRMLYMNKHPQKRKVAIVGGGPAGCQAAITAIEQGHDVTLYEKTDSLGGMVKVLEKEYLKRDITAYKHYLEHMVNKGAKVILNCAPTKEMLQKEGYDVVIVAVGAHQVVPKIPGIDQKHVYGVVDLNNEGNKIGQNVAIIGGGMSGCETAFDLAREGKHVTIIEALDKIQVEKERVSVTYAIPIKNHICNDPLIDIRRSTKCMEIGPDYVIVEDKDGKQEKITADTVVYSVGMKSNNDDVDALFGSAVDVVPIGDCAYPRNLVEATGEAFFAAMDIK